MVSQPAILIIDKPAVLKDCAGELFLLVTGQSCSLSSCSHGRGDEYDAIAADEQHGNVALRGPVDLTTGDKLQSVIHSKIRRGGGGV
jgi:hypothetical protein